MRRPRKQFTEAEDQFIIDNQSKMKSGEMAHHLGRAVSVVTSHKAILRRKRLITDYREWNVPFSPEDEKYLKENLWTLGSHECARQLGRPPSTIYLASKRLGLKINPKFRYSNRQDITHFTNPTDPFVVYFLGLMWADGDISSERKHRVKLKINKPDFLNLKKHMSRLGDFWNYHEYKDPDHPHWKTMSIFEISHLELWRFLFEHDYRIKSGASADKILSRIPDHLKHYWWRGYFDGDGCMDGLRMAFNSGFKQDWTFVEKLGKTLNIDFAIERKDRGNRAGSKAVISCSAFVKTLITFLYQGEEFGLKRKWKKSMQYLSEDKERRKKLVNSFLVIRLF